MSIQPVLPKAGPEDGAGQLPGAGEGGTGSTTLRSEPSRSAKAAMTTAAEWSLVIASYLALFFENHWVGSDGGLRFDALTELLDRGKIPTGKHSLVGPLFSAPLWYIGKKWLRNPRLGCAYYNWLLLGIGLVLFARLLSGFLAPPATRRFLLLLAAGSMFTYHVQAYYGEVFTAVLVGVGVLSVCTERRALLGWIAIVLGSANTPATSFGTGLVCLFFVLAKRRVRFLIPVAAVVALAAAESLLRRGGFKSGYEWDAGVKTIMPYSGMPGFSYPLFIGLVSQVFSFGKGILFYAPGIFAPVGSLLRDKPVLTKAFRVWLVFLVGLMLVYARWWAWQGGEFWGPRFVMFASIPASFALAISLGERRTIARSFVTLAMLTLSVWIGADGTLFGQKNEGLCSANGYALEHLCWYVPEFAAWIRPFVVSRSFTTQDYLFAGLYAVVYVVLAGPQVVFLSCAIPARLERPIRRALNWHAWGL